MTVSDEIRARHDEIRAEVSKSPEKRMEQAEAKIQLLQQNDESHLNDKIKDALLQTLSELYEIAPAQERLGVLQNFKDGNYHQVIEDLEKYSKLVKDSNTSARVQELANMVGMAKIDAQEYFSREITTP